MSNLLKTLLCAATIFVFASCGREPLPVYPPVVPNIQLAQYMEIDTASGGTPDTTTILKFEYDALKRLITLNFYYSTDSVDQSLHYEKYVYQYNSTDTLPSIMMYSYREGSATDSSTQKDTSYYTYNTLGKILTDSTLSNYSSSLGSSHNYTKRKYNYFTDYFIIQKAEENNGTISESYDSVLVGTSGRNVNSIFSQSFSLPDSIPGYNYNVSLEYDNNPNPFRKIPALYPTFQVFEYDDGFASLLQLNNPITVARNNSNGEVSNETITYTYYDNGYPSVLRSVYTNSSTTNSYKGIFTYIE